MEAADTATIAQAICGVADALDRAAIAPVMSASDSDLLAALAATPVLRNRLDSLCARIARAAEQTRAVNRDGSRDAATWIGKKTSEEPRTVRADVRRSQWLDSFGEFAAAHEVGILSTAHLRLLQRADRLEHRLQLVCDQAIFVELAKNGDFAGFEFAVQRWINSADPDGKLPVDQQRNNHLSTTRRSDGSVSLKGELDPLLGTGLVNAINAEFEKLVTAASDLSFAERPTRSALRAQALANLVAKGAVRSDGTLPAPLINIVLSEQVAADLVEGLIPHINADDIDSRCEFIDGTPLHPAFAAKLMPRAMFRRIVFDAKSRPIDVSVNARLFPRWMKDVALVQTRGRCSEPGCDAPTSWLQADHVHPHSKGGATRLDNVTPLCGPDNRAKRDRLPDKHNELEKPDESAA